MPKQVTISPIDNSAVKEIELPSDDQVDAALSNAVTAFKSYRKLPLEKRISIINTFLDAFEKEKDDVGEEICREMGRPIRFGGGEVSGFLERARYMVSVARKALADIPQTDTDKPGFRRYLKKEPLGVLFLIVPWNYPYLTQVNSIIPALLAGNAILIKPSPQTPSSSERIVRLLNAAGLPKDVAQVLHLSLAQVDKVASDKRIPFVSFTGSVSNGLRIEEMTQALAAGRGFKKVNLELGGKDAAYVREDADVAYTAENVADGGFFNSGQSCCAVERVYVHEKIYDAFVEEIVRVLKGYKLGDPREKEVTIGPVISVNSAKAIRSHYKDAISKGAKAHLDESLFPAAKEGTTYVNPQIFTNVDHNMLIMSEETFGPAIGIMKVKSDSEAIQLINDSQYGLTCSIWTRDEARFEELVPEIEAGTVYLNRCDYCDPALAWTGRKDSGRGNSLSTFGFDAVTQLKSVNMKSI